MSNVTIVVEGGIVQRVYATDTDIQVTVLDFDIDGAPPPEVVDGIAKVIAFSAVSFDEMSLEERAAITAMTPKLKQPPDDLKRL